MFSERVSQYKTSFIKVFFATLSPCDLLIHLIKDFMCSNGSNTVFVSLNVFSVTSRYISALLKLIHDHKCCKKKKMSFLWFHMKLNRKIKSHIDRKFGFVFSYNAKKSGYLYDKSHHG